MLKQNTYHVKQHKAAINLLLLAIILTIISCSNSTNEIASIKIGPQTWSAKNLDVSSFRNGDRIPVAKTNEEWLKAGNEHKADPRGLAPEGWHVPTLDEWITLTTYSGGESDAGGKLKETGTTHWNAPNTDATNVTGFRALPGGYRNVYGEYSDLGGYGGWWSSTEYSATNAWARTMYYDNTLLYRMYDNKQYGFSVRCVKD
jgi:uncharacterized protein (TIGR02145 family)